VIFMSSEVERVAVLAHELGHSYSALVDEYKKLYWRLQFSGSAKNPVSNVGTVRFPLCCETNMTCFGFHTTGHKKHVVWVNDPTISSHYDELDEYIKPKLMETYLGLGYSESEIQPVLDSLVPGGAISNCLDSPVDIFTTFDLRNCRDATEPICNPPDLPDEARSPCGNHDSCPGMGYDLVGSGDSREYIPNDYHRDSAFGTSSIMGDGEASNLIYPQNAECPLRDCP
jgi:hypothetical protein